MRLNDALIGGLLLALGCAVILMAQGLPEMPGQDFGPSLFPTIIGCGFLGCGAVIGGRGLKTRGQSPLVSFSDWRGGARKVVAGAWLVVGMVVYIAAFDAVGFIVLSVIYTGGLMAILKVRPLPAAVWSVVITIAVFELFTRMLYVPLPLGILDGLV